MLWKIYVWIFAVINVLSLVSFQYSFGLNQLIGFISLGLSVGLNVAVFSYSYKKPIFSRKILDLLFKLNLVLYGVFFLFEFITFFQEAIGAGINLPTSGFVSVIASFPSLPALYVTYKLAYLKTSNKKSKSKTRKNH